MDAVHICALAGYSFFILLSLALWMRARGAAGRAEVLAAELSALRGAPIEREYRIEQFGLLWFPKVTFQPGSGEEAKAVAGLPHCASCVVPLKAGAAGEPWSCPGCGGSHPASVTDITVTGTIESSALRYFCERPPKGAAKA